MSRGHTDLNTILKQIVPLILNPCRRTLTFRQQFFLTTVTPDLFKPRSILFQKYSLILRLSRVKCRPVNVNFVVEILKLVIKFGMVGARLHLCNIDGIFDILWQSIILFVLPIGVVRYDGLWSWLTTVAALWKRAGRIVYEWFREEFLFSIRPIYWHRSFCLKFWIHQKMKWYLCF